MTLDGYGEFPKYPGSDAPSDAPSQAFVDMWIDRYDSVDTVVFGRRAYEDHVNVHSLAARKPSDPKFLFEFSRFLERSQKVVLSHNLTKVEWQNSRIMKGNLSRIVARLRREPGKDIIVDGAPRSSKSSFSAGWPTTIGCGFGRSSSDVASNTGGRC